jgi:hypothetical protein
MLLMLLLLLLLLLLTTLRLCCPCGHVCVVKDDIYASLSPEQEAAMEMSFDERVVLMGPGTVAQLGCVHVQCVRGGSTHQDVTAVVANNYCWGQ